jgi:hypothetical protein
MHIRKNRDLNGGSECGLDHFHDLFGVPITGEPAAVDSSTQIGPDDSTVFSSGTGLMARLVNSGVNQACLFR